MVEGDDVSAQVRELIAAGQLDMFTAQPLPERVLSANAYLGAVPIAAALAAGADIVITGRCVDSAVTLGPLMHEFGWSAATSIASPAAASPDTSSSAAARRPAAFSPTGRACRAGRRSAIRSSSAGPTAASR